MDHFRFGKTFRGTVGRNHRCPCGSGKKFKKCCLRAQKEEAIMVEQEPPQPEEAADIRPLLVNFHADKQYVDLVFDNDQHFKTWDYVLAVLHMAQQYAMEMKRHALAQEERKAALQKKVVLPGVADMASGRQTKIGQS